MVSCPPSGLVAEAEFSLSVDNKRSRAAYETICPTYANEGLADLRASLSPLLGHGPHLSELPEPRLVESINPMLSLSDIHFSQASRKDEPDFQKHPALLVLGTVETPISGPLSALKRQVTSLDGNDSVGSILGLTLRNILIIHLYDGIKCTQMKFASDTKLSREVDTGRDRVILQEDLNKLVIRLKTFPKTPALVVPPLVATINANGHLSLLLRAPTVHCLRHPMIKQLNQNS
ncbi:hypothetical protein WISP_14501 [Willisornis vidua]|uniref:Uncharacterized protein n=1 Tax=Willisornis vidua TaxID=1566151 RepID=A0ABQ9DVX1_9PASS|nr:hypothetical protein WISP_14501 [Willisornis vidua]